MRCRGTVAAFSRKRNFLLIRPEGEERRIYCHRSEVVDETDVEPGAAVEYTVTKQRANEARRVRLVPEPTRRDLLSGPVRWFAALLKGCEGWILVDFVVPKKCRTAIVVRN